MRGHLPLQARIQGGQVPETCGIREVRGARPFVTEETGLSELPERTDEDRGDRTEGGGLHLAVRLRAHGGLSRGCAHKQGDGGHLRRIGQLLGGCRRGQEAVREVPGLCPGASVSQLYYIHITGTGRRFAPRLNLVYAGKHPRALDDCAYPADLRCELGVLVADPVRSRTYLTLELGVAGAFLYQGIVTPFLPQVLRYRRIRHPEFACDLRLRHAVCLNQLSGDLSTYRWQDIPYDKFARNLHAFEKLLTIFNTDRKTVRITLISASWRRGSS